MSSFIARLDYTPQGTLTEKRLFRGFELEPLEYYRHQIDNEERRPADWIGPLTMNQPNEPWLRMLVGQRLNGWIVVFFEGDASWLS